MTWEDMHRINRESAEQLEADKYRRNHINIEAEKERQAERGLTELANHIETVFKWIRESKPQKDVIQTQIESIKNTMKNGFLGVTDQQFRDRFLSVVLELKPVVTKQKDFCNAVKREATELLRNSYSVRHGPV